MRGPWGAVEEGAAADAEWEWGRLQGCWQDGLQGPGSACVALWAPQTGSRVGLVLGSMGGDPARYAWGCGGVRPLRPCSFHRIQAWVDWAGSGASDQQPEAGMSGRKVRGRAYSRPAGSINWVS